MTLRAHRLRPKVSVPGLATTDRIPPETRALLEAILPITAHRFGVAIVDLVRHCRQSELVRARAFVVWALRLPRPPLSYPAIGSLLGDRDHTGMIHLHEKAIRLRLGDPEFRDACDHVAAAFAKFEESFNGHTRH